MSKRNSEISPFTLTGQLLDFIVKDGYKIKGLRLAIAEREYWVKIPKSLRSNLDPNLKPGCWLTVTGYREIKNLKIKLEAETLRLVNPSEVSCPVVTTENTKEKNQGSILICQKAGCWKQGGEELYQALAESLQAYGLEDKVKIKTTGCLKQCKQAPNLVFMPAKTRYGQLAPHTVVQLVEKHFGQTL